MVGKLVNATNIDSVRIECFGGRALTISCSLVESVDARLRMCYDINEPLVVFPDGGVWRATCGGNFVGIGPTLIQAIANMEKQ